MYFVLWLFLSLLIVGLTEYAVHRWFLHDRQGGDFWQAHTVEHHGKELMEARHTAYSWSQFLTATTIFAPIWLTSLLFVDSNSIILPLIFLWVKLSHETVHRAVHNEIQWYVWLICPWWLWCRTHHLKHHKKLTCNFGFLFPWTDLFFGTYRV